MDASWQKIGQCCGYSHIMETLKCQCDICCLHSLHKIPYITSCNYVRLQINLLLFPAVAEHWELLHKTTNQFIIIFCCNWYKHRQTQMKTLYYEYRSYLRLKSKTSYIIMLPSQLRMSEQPIVFLTIHTRKNMNISFVQSTNVNMQNSTKQ